MPTSIRQTCSGGYCARLAAQTDVAGLRRTATYRIFTRWSTQISSGDPQKPPASFQSKRWPKGTPALEAKIRMSQPEAVCFVAGLSKQGMEASGGLRDDQYKWACGEPITQEKEAIWKVLGAWVKGKRDERLPGQQ
ncbi:hypothetical protein CFIO01_11254 [Colletotrichum fioriniae PJ7]|uniref:Uncharacterized protein n=1 Tax=Colletotrichum fioriniae PJ7 TaxID=1445577 RepID=A0A010S4Q1_9PEZI|nr:hypothetical protein CFIO01_11254 [Colletotrichum fioriniae PJ7]